MSGTLYVSRKYGSQGYERVPVGGLPGGPGGQAGEGGPVKDWERRSPIAERPTAGALSRGDHDEYEAAIEAALMGVAADNVKRWVYKGPDGKWCVR